MKYQKFAQGTQDIVVNTETKEVIAIFFQKGEAEEYVHRRLENEGLLKEEEDNRPEHWRTGIKVINRVPHYQVHCKCPNCRNTQTKYVQRGAKTVVCSECAFHLSVQVATEAFGTRDEFGNFFIAYRLG